MGVPVVPLSGVGTLCAVVLLVLAFRWGWHHPVVLANWAWNGGGTALGILTGYPCRSAQAAVIQVFAWFVAIYLLSFLLPAGMGRPTRQTLRTLPVLFWKWLRSLTKALRPLVIRSARTARGKGSAAPKGPEKDKD